MSIVILCFTKRKHFENYEKRFLYYQESCSPSQNIHFFIIYSLHFHSAVHRFKRSDETGMIMILRMGLRKLGNVTFGKTQKPLSIK